MLLIAGGDPHAFERLFWAFKDRVYQIALTYTESPLLSEEITQDVFIRIWLKRWELPAIRDFSAWLFTIAKNHAFNTLRNQQNRQRAIQEMAAHVPSTAGDADEKLQSAQTQRLVAEGMELLSPPQRQVFQLIRLDGLSREEAARVMGLSPNTIKVHLHFGIKVVRSYLLKNGGYLSLFFLHRHFF